MDPTVPTPRHRRSAEHARLDQLLDPVDDVDAECVELVARTVSPTCLTVIADLVEAVASRADERCRQLVAVAYDNGYRDGKEVP